MALDHKDMRINGRLIEVTANMTHGTFSLCYNITFWQEWMRVRQKWYEADYVKRIPGHSREK